MSKLVFAVLTGDLVKSSRLDSSELTLTRNNLLQAVGDVKRWKKGLVQGKSEFFRGDAWQVLLTEPTLALRVALYLRACTKAHSTTDTRIAIGMGAVEEIAQQRVSLSSGEAFVLSGHSLDHLNPLVRMSIAMPETSGIFGQWMPVVAGLCDALAGQWKQRQAEIVSLALLPVNLNHEEIAERLDSKVSRQTVTKSLKGANWHSLKIVVDEFERSNWQAICRGIQ